MRRAWRGSGVLASLPVLAAISTAVDPCTASAQVETAVVTIAGRIASFTPAFEEVHVPGNTDGLGLTEATFRAPFGITVDADGNILVADSTSAAPPFPGIVRIVSPILGSVPVSTRGTILYTVGPSPSLGSLFGGTASVALPGASGITDVAVTTVATPATGPAGSWVVAARGSEQIRVYSPAGALVSVFGTGIAGDLDGAAASARFNTPTAVALDGAGNVFVADQTNHRIRRIDAASGSVSTLAGAATPHQLAADCNLACSATVQGGFADGPANTTAQFKCPSGIAVGVGGNDVFVADSCNHRIRRVDQASGIVSTVAGSIAGFSDGIGAVARFDGPVGIEASGTGTLFVTDVLNQKVRRVTAGGSVTTIGVTEIITVDAFDLLDSGVAPPLKPAGNHFDFPWGIALGTLGVAGLTLDDEILFVSDLTKFRIREVQRLP